MVMVTIRRGDYAARLARLAGFRRFETVWTDPANADLRGNRNPNVLAAGDELFVLDREAKTEEAETGRRHKFVSRNSVLRLRIRVETWAGPLADSLAIVTEAEGERPGGPVGQCDVIIEPTASQAELRVRGEAVSLWIGGLEPVETTSGLAARLHNLGYLASPDEPGDVTYALRSAIEEFQCDHRLPVTGQADSGTVERLRAEHGC
jgi:hypothetical protein